MVKVQLAFSAETEGYVGLQISLSVYTALLGWDKMPVLLRAKDLCFKCMGQGKVSE